MTEVPVITETPDVSEDSGIIKVNKNKKRTRFVKVNRRAKIISASVNDECRWNGKLMKPPWTGRDISRSTAPQVCREVA